MGGNSLLLVEPRTVPEFAAAVRALRQEGLAFRLLGGGANVLVDDRGLDEVVVLTTAINFMMRDNEDGSRLRVGAGLSIPTFVQRCTEQGLAGAECLVGIPGTMGGATVMNAGGRHGWFSSICRRVRVLTPEGAEEEVAVGDDTFGYRSSIFGDCAVLESVLELARGDREESKARIRTYLKEKGSAQPLTEKSAGCIFKNPPGGSAGKVLEQAGVKGWREGGAEISEKHANFIVNRGGATLKEVQRLIERARTAVYEQSGIRLETEVKVWDREVGL